MCASPETGNAPRLSFHRINFADALDEYLVKKHSLVRQPDLLHPSNLLFFLFMHLFDRWVTESASTRPRRFYRCVARLIGTLFCMYDGRK